MRTAFLASLVAVVALAACGGDEENRSGGGQGGAVVTDPVAPSGPPPRLDMEGPPPAWVATERGAFWLAYASYCWGTACADYVADCEPGRVPTIDVSRGEKLTFHLEFEPSRVSLAFYDPPIDKGPDTVPLAAQQEPSWTVDRGGIVWLTAATGDGRDASYAACLRLEGDGGGNGGSEEPLTIEEALALGTNEPVVVQGSLYIAGREMRLCSGFAESHPPQCAGPSLRIEGLVLAAVEGLLERSGDVRWSKTPTRLRGTIEGETLTVLEVEP